MIKFNSHLTRVLILALTLFVTACMEQDPYEKFSGTWVVTPPEGLRIKADKSPPFFAFNLDPQRKILGIRVMLSGRDGQGWLLLEVPVQAMEVRDGSLALNLGENRPDIPVRDPIMSMGSLMLEPLEKDVMLARCYSMNLPLAKLLDGKAPKPDLIEEARRPDSEQAALLDQARSSYQAMNGDWYLESSWEKPAMTLDVATGKVRLRDSRLIKELGNTSLNSSAYLEVQIDKRKVGSILFEKSSEDISPPELEIDLAQKPPVATLKMLGNTFAMLPDMGVFERQQYQKSKEEARRAAAKAELEAKRRQDEEARIHAEQRRMAEEKARAEAEARQKALDEKRAAMPEFSFNDIRLSDNPQQMVKKGLELYRLGTSFPVQQKGNSIAGIKNPNIGYLPFLMKDPAISDALDGLEARRMTVGSRYRRLGSESSSGYFIGPDESAGKAGVRSDVIIFADKTRDDPTATLIQAGFYTLPDGEPRPLYLNVDGDIVLDALEVFRERYGEPESVLKDDNGIEQHVWRSNSEIAIMRTEPADKQHYRHYELYIISLPAYAELQKFTRDLHEQEEASKKAAEEAELARKKAASKARKAGI